MILAADIGGTKVHLALYSFAGGRLKAVRDEIFAAHEFASLDAVVEKFLAGGGDGTKATTEIPNSAQNDAAGGVAALCSAGRLLLRASDVRDRCAMGG